MNIIWKGAKAFTKGREGKTVKHIVIHWVGQGDLETANAWFNRSGANTSAHYGIENTRVYQWVKDEDTAWAVGNWVGNTESISIEHSATPDRPATEETYKTSAELIQSLCTKYNLPVNTNTIKPHKFYSATSCPGTMDINKIIKLIQGEDMTKIEELEEDINKLEATLEEKRQKIKELEDEKDKFEDLYKMELGKITLAKEMIKTLENDKQDLANSKFELNNLNEKLAEELHMLSLVKLRVESEKEELEIGFSQLQDDYEVLKGKYQDCVNANKASILSELSLNQLLQEILTRVKNMLSIKQISKEGVR